MQLLARGFFYGFMTNKSYRQILKIPVMLINIVLDFISYMQIVAIDVVGMQIRISFFLKP